MVGLGGLALWPEVEDPYFLSRIDYEANKTTILGHIRGSVGSCCDSMIGISSGFVFAARCSVIGTSSVVRPSK